MLQVQAVLLLLGGRDISIGGPSDVSFVPNNRVSLLLQRLMLLLILRFIFNICPHDCT